MRTSGFGRLASVLLASAALLAAHEGNAKDSPRAVVEVSTPPPGLGADAAGLRSAAQAEAQKMDAVLLRERRRVVISLALKETATAPVACSVNATVRDARTGALLVIIETGAHAEGTVTQETRKEMAYAVVRDAVRRVPRALHAK
jgi:hypothetical protein